MPISDQDELLQIGSAAERVGLSLRTVRYWEEVGLVRPPTRTDGGFRLYSVLDIQRLLVVKNMKPLGLSLEEMRDLLELLEPSADPENLPEREFARLVEALHGFAERTDGSIEKLERQLIDARTLQTRITERLARCDAAALNPAGLQR